MQTASFDSVTLPLQGILEERRPITHLFQLLIGILCSPVLLRILLVPSIDVMEQELQRQSRHDSGRGKGQRATEARWIFWLFLVDVDETADDTTAVAHT